MAAGKTRVCTFCGAPLVKWNKPLSKMQNAAARLKMCEQCANEIKGPAAPDQPVESPSKWTTWTRVDDREVMRLWRECGLPEYFLGNGGTNVRLVTFAQRIRDALRKAADQPEKAQEEAFSLSEYQTTPGL